MHITKIEWRGIKVPIKQPPEPPPGKQLDRFALLLWIHTEDGLVGVGEASPPGPGSSDRIAAIAALLHDLAPSALGLAPSVALDVLTTLAPHSRRGDALRFGLETATLDLLGQSALRPVADLLGGVIDWVPMNAIINFVAPGEAALQATEAVADGYECIKVSLGNIDSDVDVEVVKQVREAIGGDVALRADADESWTPERAISVLQRLEPFNLEYVEQPVMAEDLTGLARVRRTVPMPIAADEAVGTMEDAEKVIAAEAADVLIIKPSRAGGVRTAQAMMELAKSKGHGSVVTSSLETGIGIAAALHLAASLGKAPASGLATGELLEHDLLKNPLVPVRGHITVPQTPGLGVQLDQIEVDRYTTGVMGVIAG